MEEIPIIDQLPEKWRGTALLLLLVLPYITRAWHAWKMGGGLYGMRDAILFGTNKPKQ